MTQPTHPISADGRCLCGKVRYHIEGDAFGIIYCHCQRCRKHTGAAFAPFVIASGEITWTSGKDNLGVYKHDVAERAFCRDCGSSMPVPHSDPNKLSNIHGGNILDMAPPLDSWHLFTASACPWTSIPADANRYDTVAPGHEAFDPKLPDLERAREAGRITGSCLCGQTSFAAAEPIGMMNCHCTRCRLSRASAHATNLFVAADDFEWRSGEDLILRYKLPGAERFGASFCGHCGSLMPRGNDQRVNIPAGCLDSDPGVVPRGHIFVGSKAAWFPIHDALPQWQERAT